MTHLQAELMRLAMEFVIANRDNATLMQNSEYRELADAADREYSARLQAVAKVQTTPLVDVIKRTRCDHPGCRKLANRIDKWIRPGCEILNYRCVAHSKGTLTCDYCENGTLFGDCDRCKGRSRVAK